MPRSDTDTDIDELTAQLQRLVEIRLLDPLEIMLDDRLPEVRAATLDRARQWAQTLGGDDDRAATATVVRLIAALYPADGDAAFDPPGDWWRTPLGRVVARRVGHPGAAAVTYAVAGAMLGITRQGVHDLLTRGKLARHPDGGVAVSSIRARLDAATEAR